MVHHFWRLSEAGDSNLGLACTADGLLLGRTLLIERRGERFVVREKNEIDRLFRCAYQNAVVVERMMHGLKTVAAALNADDQCLARIAAVHLRIPDLPDAAARDSMETEDCLIKYARSVDEADLGSRLSKASPDDPKHPGWPKGTPDGRGGKFRPKDGSGVEIPLEIKLHILRIVLRRALRTGVKAILHFAAEGLLNFIPIVDVAADVAAAVDALRTVSEFRKLADDAAAAFDFAKKGPHSLEDLQVSSNGYEQFSSYGQFLKVEMDVDLLAKRFGPAGPGYQYHHIVTQGGANAENLSPQQLQNTDNIIRLPTLLHEMVNAKYAEPAPKDPSMTLYQWLQTQPYNVQREWGLKILRELHIIK